MAVPGRAGLAGADLERLCGMAGQAGAGDAGRAARWPLPAAPRPRAAARHGAAAACPGRGPLPLLCPSGNGGPGALLRPAGPPARGAAAVPGRPFPLAAPGTGATADDPLGQSSPIGAAGHGPAGGDGNRTGCAVAVAGSGVALCCHGRRRRAGDGGQSLRGGDFSCASGHRSCAVEP